MILLHLNDASVRVGLLPKEILFLAGQVKVKKLEKTGINEKKNGINEKKPGRNLLKIKQMLKMKIY